MIFGFDVFQDVWGEGALLVERTSRGQPDHKKGECDDEIEGKETSRETLKDIANHLNLLGDTCFLVNISLA